MGGKAWLAASLARMDPSGPPPRTPLVVLTESHEKGLRLAQDITFYLPGGGVFFFPPWDTLPFDTFSPQKEVMALRFDALAALAEGQARVLVVTVQSWMQGMMPHQEFHHLRTEFEQGKPYPRAVLTQTLESAGYVRVEQVEAAGEYSLRGEIVDVFPLQSDQPVRLDFFDEELESIRLFDADTQVSTGELERVEVYPASEGVVNRQTAQTALRELPHHKSRVQPDVYRQIIGFLERGQTFPGVEQVLPLLYGQAGWLHQALDPETVVILDEPRTLEDRSRHFGEELLAEYQISLEQGALALSPESFFLSPEGFGESLNTFYRVEFHGLQMAEGSAGTIYPFADNHSLRALAQTPGQSAHSILEGLVARLKEWQTQGAAIFLTSRSDTGAERLRHLLAGLDLGAVMASGVPTEPSEGELWPLGNPPSENFPDTPIHDITLLPGGPAEGFRVVDEGGETRLAVITEEELLGEKTRQSRLKKSSLSHFFTSLGELKEGDPVVHVSYGVGRYEGLRRISAGRGEEDFLVLAFAGGDKVYVPVYHFNQVQKYTGLDTANPPLSRLGDGSWAKATSKARRVVKEMAVDLVALYARREAKTGHGFVGDDGLVAEFEEAFPYQETEDQEQAIRDVLADMRSEKPMDRLVCGDVGFGKTEVAMRAAYLAALDSKQVIVLVPTTILAQQHYETFLKRFSGFPVSIDVISRFRSPAEQKEVLQNLSAGRLDILIGTHRLLSKDVTPMDLGLLVVDEEQRFGVAHKEKIKLLKTQVDVVTLSATPIPRTLHMSMMGVRDLSIINTPPMDRMSIRTRLVKSSDYIIKEAVSREIRRGGQIFVVHNRVETIHAFGAYLQSILPGVSFGVAHGQMGEHQLEEVMMDFIEGRTQVLLSTSIIESGLDIPRANTILVNNADSFGLSQLYQMRGRVGRSNVQAYAYLLVSPDKLLTEVAQRRLTLLQELNDLGSGFKIASHDLEIRGAGNLLGGEQSGHINSVGLELYTQMVADAVADIRGEESAGAALGEFKLELGFPYVIPSGYIESTRQRLDVYKQLAEVRRDDEVWELRQNLEDRFGRVTPEVDNLLTLIRIRLAASRYGLASLEKSGEELAAQFGPGSMVDVERLMTLVADPKAGVRLLPGDRLLLGPAPATPEAVLERIKVLEAIMAPQAA